MTDSVRRVAWIAYASVLLVIICWFVADFPILWPELAIGFLVYAGCLWRWRWLWLIFLPALLPLFDLAPWSGRFFFDEFDAFVLVTAAVLALHEAEPNAAVPLPRSLLWALGLLIASYFLSTLARLWPLAPITADSFANYASPYNSLRVAKGFVWSLLLFRPLTQAVASQKNAKLLLGFGFLIGLQGVALVSVYERWLFTGVLTWVTTYRTTASFSSMHTGDGPIDVWLAMTMPFLGLLLIHPRWVRLLPLTAALGILSLYSLLVTESRGPLIAVAIAYGVGLLALLATRPLRRRAAAALLFSLGVIALIVVATLPILLHSSLAERFKQTREDAQFRLGHWRDALALRTPTASSELFGMGLGSFPAIHQQRSTREPRATRFQFVSEGPDHFLSLWPGQSLYMGQAVTAEQHSTYFFRARVRASDSDASFTVAWCELWMLSSANCTWDSFPLKSRPGQWLSLTRTIQTNQVGSGRRLAGFFVARPTRLTFMVGGPSTTRIDVTDLSLKDKDDRELLRNGNFSQGSDNWFWTVDQHLQWHTKNLAVNILFDQGWLGIAAVGFLLWTTLVRLVREISDSNPLSAVFLASLTGFLVSGVAVSTFDQPRLALAFYLLCYTCILPNTTGPQPNQIGQDERLIRRLQKQQ